MNIHTTTIHGRCPLNGSWDYYTLQITTNEFLESEKIQEIADKIRDCKLTQEQIADSLARRFPTHCMISLIGSHGQNADLETVRWGTAE